MSFCPARGENDHGLPAVAPSRGISTKDRVGRLAPPSHTTGRTVFRIRRLSRQLTTLQAVMEPGSRAASAARSTSPAALPRCAP